MCAQRYCMPEPTVELTDRIIMDEIAADSRVIDLGCGDGRLLQKLRVEMGCSVQGVELDHQEFLQAVAHGVAVINGDLDEGLSDIPSGSFDFAVLSQTLQQVRHPKELLAEMLRIAKRALVVVPNYGHWRVRLEVVWKGRAPVTESLPYDWYDTPNIHFMSLHDFRDLAGQLDCRVIKERPIIKGHAVDRAWAANLRAENVLYVLERSES